MTTRSSSKRKAEWIASSFGNFQEAIPQKIKSRKPNNSSKNVINLVDTESDEAADDHLPWVEKYKPISEEDLAVHKKKIQEVKSWIESLFNDTCSKNCSSKILLLTGPTGSAKTATVQVLKNSLQYEIKEWINPLMQEFDRENLRDYSARQESQSQLFHDFLLRANRYEQLSLFDSKDVDASRDHNKGHTVILVEDMPNFLLFDPKKMHTILRQYTKSGRCALIFIMSDSSTDNFTNALFPKNLQSELKIANVSFNAVAFTGLVKSMNKIVNLETKEGEYINVPSKDVLDLLATSSIGDIRSCINALQFYCTACDPNSKQKAATKSKQKTQKTKTVDKNSSNKLAAGGGFVGEKDTSLFLFRALGKILYSKRDKEEVPMESSHLPSHLKCHRRRKMLVDAEDVFERTQVTSDNFLLYLHQNYPEFFRNIDDVSTAGNYCSEADVMSGVWTSRSIMADYSASLSMRGIMFSNTRPSSSGGTTAGGWRSMHKPQWFEATKTINSREKFARQIFKVLRYSKETLFTEVLPHVGQYTSSSSQVQEIACFPMNRQLNQKSREALTTLATVDSESPLDYQQYIEPYSNFGSDALNNGDNVDDEEDIIEDFED